jgi:pimeloyl-ACP methyl ester carboxylesterase
LSKLRNSLPCIGPTRLFLTSFFFLGYLLLFAQEMDSTHTVNVFLFPGQGSDHRLFQEFRFPNNFKTHNITLPTPEKRGMTMREYALQVAEQIDTSGNTFFIGVSLGGMVCVELNKIYDIEKTFIISSAKCRSELPFRYRFQKYVPLYFLFPKRLIKWGSYIAQPLVEPDRNVKKEICVSMLRSKDPLYLKRTIGIIVRWEGGAYNENIVHIHGNNDHTIPIRNVKYHFLIENGSHMMTLTRAREVSEQIRVVLNTGNSEQ